ncbi:50S ribosomal protein L25 [Candidatus Dojkabacteria bacterium]|uniref:Large ribosomal subunit protein bL25 n=1 Tax=Candidatus Dojkabacteria bacterium TaxID=2099670 RepID=A0A955RM31_9BACT|nr:50S ribosomal protein L25 [Candidatus Dojkabacteria bacterium]
MKLTAQKRTLVGKKVKNLRAEGIVPATIYGPKRESENIQFNEKDFEKAFEKSGFSKFIELTVEGEKSTRVLVKEVNYDPIKDNILDISIYDIDEDRKVTVDVPINLEGESPAVKLKLGFLVQQLETVAVYCLPKDLPESFTISVNTLESTSDTVALNDLQLPEGVEFDSGVDPTSSIAYIATAQKEEELEEESAEGSESEEGEEGEEGEKEAGESSEEEKGE